MRVLGVPVARSGNDSGLRAYLEREAQRITADLDLISHLPDKQVAHSVLRACLGPVQAQFLLRTVDHSCTREMAATIESGQRKAWGRVVGGDLSPQAWLQSTLPISKGGCGLQFASQMALDGRAASTISFMQKGDMFLGLDEGISHRISKDVGLLGALRAATSPALEPIKSWCENGRFHLRHEESFPPEMVARPPD